MRILLLAAFAASVALAAQPEITDIPDEHIEGIIWSSTIPRPRRSPKITVASAIARSRRFLREHHHDPSKYYVASAHWASASDKTEEDAWLVNWVARDGHTKPPAFLIVVRDETHVFFGSRA